MGKILVFIRTSTIRQELEDQKSEMISFVSQYGYKVEDIIFLEDKGASAIKLNTKYLNMVDVLKEYIKSEEINSVAVWHMNRLGRNDEILIELKNLFIKHRIQFICKNPNIILLNPDGSVNEGAELAFGLFATMVKQDMIEKKAKFKRAKTSNALKGRWNGGHKHRYGYTIDENNFYIINKPEAEIIKTIFELYSTNKYSAVSLQKELKERGIVLDKQKIMNILSSDAYCGRPQEKWNNRVYPSIISEELFDKCEAIRKDNKIIRKGEKLCLGGKLIKCECGGTFTSNAKAYSCCRHSVRKVCGNSITIKKSVIEPLLWRIASTLHLDYLMGDNETRIEECKNEIAVINTKINTATNTINKIDDKKNRVIELYVEGLINAENKAQKLNKIQEEYHRYTNELNTLKEAKIKLESLIKDIELGDEVEALMKAMDIMEEDEKSMEYQYDIIHKYITQVELKREWFGEERDNRAKKENGIHIYIHTILGIWEYMYIPNGYKGNKIFKKNNSAYIVDEI